MDILKEKFGMKLMLLGGLLYIVKNQVKGDYLEFGVWKEIVLLKTQQIEDYDPMFMRLTAQ